MCDLAEEVFIKIVLNFALNVTWYCVEQKNITQIKFDSNAKQYNETLHSRHLK